MLDIDESIYIKAQSSRLVQVFINLLTNAAKAIPGENPDDNRVTIRGKADDKLVTVYVSDTGVGIAEENLSQIFDPFFSISLEDQEPGAGIGLALVKDILKEYEGTIAAASEVGLGTTFTIRLPRAATTESPISVVPDETPVESIRSSYHILFFDSEEANLLEYKKSFGAMHEVFLTNTIEEFEKAIREQHETIDVIVCELPLPKGKGTLDIAEMLKHWPDLDQRFILIGKPGPDLEEARANGFTVFEKPVRLAILLGAIYDLGLRQPSQI